MFVSAGDLKAGMVINRDLHDGACVLLRQGAVITDVMIRTIHDRGIKAVDICDTGEVSAHDSGVFSIKSLELDTNEEYVRERQVLEELFADIDDTDAQMQTLKYCIFSQLEEDYRDQQG